MITTNRWLESLNIELSKLYMYDILLKYTYTKYKT